MRNSVLRSNFSQAFRPTRIFRLALLAVLAAGLTAVPCRMTAQAGAPAAQAAPAPAAAQTAKPDAAPAKEAPKTEQEQADVYRHAPVVKAIAKALHMDVETVARISEFINFGIIFLVVAIALVRVMPRVLRKRSQTVSHNIAEARKQTEDANARLTAVEAKMANLDGEIAKFRAEIEAESLQDEVRIKAALKDESDRMVQAAEQEIEVAAAQAKRALRHFAADLAIDQAARQMVLTPEADRALIAEFVGDMAKSGGNLGGQN